MVRFPSGLLTSFVNRSALRTMSRIIGLLLLCLSCACQAALGGERDRTLLVFGDSLSAAYGLRADQGWVALLEKRVADRGYRVVNASVSGETTAGGRARLARALEQHRPSIVVLELGGNDGLRGLPVGPTAANLDSMVTTIRAAGAKVLLLGIRIPPNYGSAYADRFSQMYTDIASRYKLPLVPFLLEGVALKPELMQADGVHPRAEGQPRVAENVWAKLSPLL
ncbi:MAG: arylesterase [Proteobacteria bacterium]|nr:MAG: arylesterase [Pseudomonadota bacterium]